MLRERQLSNRRREAIITTVELMYSKQQPVLLQTESSGSNVITDMIGDLGLTGQDYFMIGIVAFILIVLSVFGGNGKKGKLTSSRWAKGGEKSTALKKLRQQIATRKSSEVGLYCGNLPKGGLSWKSGIGGTLPTVPVADANRGIMVMGSAGSGKTYSVIDPLLFSGIDQGLGILLYDYKGEQKENIATQAARHGYTVNIFAPGKPWTCVINPLDFIESSTDTLGAKNLAKVLYKNTLDADSSGDPFFEPASQQLVQALLQLAKATEYPDLAMAYAFLRLHDMPKRVLEASKKKQMYSPWIREQFSQIAGLAEEDAGKTTGGIIAGAQNLLLPFIQPDLMACFVGKTNAPTYINEKQILVFENDINRQEVLAPILAAIIHMVVLKNFAKERDTGLLVALDEVPTIQLPDLAKYPAEFRSKGCVTILGLQNMAQLAQAYGDKKADIVAANMSTKFMFNPAHQETAKKFSEYIGDTEVVVTNANRGQNFNMTGNGRSKGTSETIQIIPLMRPEEILRMKRDCVLINPAYGTSTEGSIPWHIPGIKIPRPQAQAYAKNREIWANQLEPRLVEREKKRLGIETFDQLNKQMEAALNVRIDFAEQMLPMPPKETATPPNRAPAPF